MKSIAVIGAGMSGLAAAYLLSRRHRVQLFEKEQRLGGHTNTVVVPTPEGSVALDTDASVLPLRAPARASWNYRLAGDPDAAPTVTCDLNRLQGLATPEQYCVTLNPDGHIDERRVLRRLVYRHPLYTRAAVEAQKQWREVSGVNRTHYCGAYWSYGFHEDGLNSEAFYTRMMGRVLVLDPAGGILAFRSMLRGLIAMPGRFMDDGSDPDLFDHFAIVAQRADVYTVRDYASIIEHLVKTWNIAGRTVTGKAAQAQDELCRQVERYQRLSDRTSVSLASQSPIAFSWLRDRRV